MTAATTPARIRPLEASDLDEADRVIRLAFGTFIGLPDPMAFMGDADYAHTRWRHTGVEAFAAEVDGAFAGSNFVTHWGSVGFFGPLTIRPDLWDRGVAQQLLEPTIASFERRGTRLAGLFTFSHSAKHIGLYQKFGYRPRFLTAIMERDLADGASVAADDAVFYSTLSAAGRQAAVSACREVASAVYDGLDLSAEIESVNAQGLGDTVLLRGSGRLEGFAVCHTGAGSEAGSGVCYVKFAAVRPGASAATTFARLLAACDALARQRGASRVRGGVNLGRTEAYDIVRRSGFRALNIGVAMHRPNETGYSHPEAFVIDDWR